MTNCSRLVIALVVLHKQSGRLEAWPSSWATVKASQLRSRAVIMGAPRSNGSDGEARVYATPRRTGGSLSPSLPFSAFVAFLRRSLATCSDSPASCSTSLAHASIAANIHSNRGFASELFNVIVSSVGQAGYVVTTTSVGAYLLGAVVPQLAVVLLSLPFKSCAWDPTWTATAGTA